MNILNFRLYDNKLKLKFVILYYLFYDFENGYMKFYFIIF